MINELIDHLAWVVAKACMRGHSTETVPGDGLPNFYCEISEISEISHEGWKKKRASGPMAPGEWMSGLKLAAAREPGPNQHRSYHMQAFAPLGLLFPKLSKLLNQGNALSAPCSSRSPSRGAPRPAHGAPGQAECRGQA
jgi:hypothetical protein